MNETESNLQECSQTTTCGSVDLVQESGTFSVMSGGDVSIQAANTNNPNVPASDVVIAAGSGTNKIGGSGGDVFVLAGNAAGGEFYSLEFASTVFFFRIITSPIHVLLLLFRHSHWRTDYCGRRKRVHWSWTGNGCWGISWRFC